MCNVTPKTADLSHGVRRDRQCVSQYWGNLNSFGKAEFASSAAKRHIRIEHCR